MDDSDDGRGVALDVQHDAVVKDVLVGKSLLRVESVDDFLLFFPIFFDRDCALEFILTPDHCVVFAVVDLELLAGGGRGD